MSTPPPCIASTQSRTSSAFYKSLEYTPDGQCLISNSDDNELRTYILPQDLLTSPDPHNLTPTNTITLPNPITAHSVYPAHHPASPSSCLTLLSTLDHPIRLQRTLHSDSPALAASYPLIHPQTERYITPASLLWTSQSHFLAGADGEIALFDASRDGQGPTERFTTRGEGMKGIVSCLSSNTDSILAAGTFSRQIGLFCHSGSGECVGVIDLNLPSDRDRDHGSELDKEREIGGTGITSVQWSPCGRYLYVAERQASGMRVYDVRRMERVGVLRGRRAKTNQRMGFDVVVHDFREPRAVAKVAEAEEAEEGPEQGTGHADAAFHDHSDEPVEPLRSSSNNHAIISSGTDGIVRIWENPHLVEGVLDPSPDLSWKASTDAVASAVVHPSCGVVATCSGQRWWGEWWEDEGEGDSGGDEYDEEVGDGGSGSASGSGRGGGKGQGGRECAIKVWDLGW